MRPERHLRNLSATPNWVRLALGGWAKRDGFTDAQIEAAKRVVEWNKRRMRIVIKRRTQPKQLRVITWESYLRIPSDVGVRRTVADLLRAPWDECEPDGAWAEVDEAPAI